VSGGGRRVGARVTYGPGKQKTPEFSRNRPSVSALSFGRSLANHVPHCPITALALIPHPGELRVVDVHVVVDADVLLAGVVPVQAARILLKRSLPRNRHSEHHGIQRRVIEALAHQPAGGDYHSRRQLVLLARLLRMLRQLRILRQRATMLLRR